MKTKKITLIIIIIFLFILGLFFTYYLNWNEEIYDTITSGAGDICVFFTYFLVSILISSLISNIKKRPSIISTKIDAKKRNEIIERIGKKEFLKYQRKNRLTVFISFIFLITFYLVGVDQYEKYHFNNYGTEISIKIIEIRNGPKGSKLAYFEYEFQQKKYRKELFLRNKKIEKVYPVIFSSKDPRIIKWAN